MMDRKTDGWMEDKRGNRIKEATHDKTATQHKKPKTKTNTNTKQGQDHSPAPNLFPNVTPSPASNRFSPPHRASENENLTRANVIFYIENSQSP